MNPTALIISYSVLIVGASLLGGVLPSLVKLTHTRMQLAMSFVSGLMLGIGLLHMLPHGASMLGSLDRAVLWMIVGLLAMFFLIRTFHFHQHEVPGEPEGHDHGHSLPHAHKLGWVGVAIGLGLHTAIDGVALAASVVAGADEGGSFPLYGIGTFLVVALHKPLDALSITSLMAGAGWSPRRRHVVNVAFAAMCPLGAGIFYLGIGDAGGAVVGGALAFAAGVFVCISLSDLLPEIQFHAHDRVKLSAMLLLGVLFAYGIGSLESGEHHGDDIPERHAPDR